MKKVQLPVFGLEIYCLFSDYKTLVQKSKALSKKYGKQHPINQLDSNKNSGGLYFNLRSNPDDENESPKKIAIIWINKESRGYKIKEKQGKTKGHILNVGSHEIRHTVDVILECHKIKDKETAAYITGYLTEEFLTDLV